MDFSHDGKQVAAEVRTSLYDYTIAVNGVCWETSYPSIWRPLFSPKDGSVTAPAKVAGSWALVRDGNLFWDKKFTQLWHHMFSADGEKVAAIVAPKFGRWTVAVDGQPWSLTFGDSVTDAVFSPDGSKVACIGKDNGQFAVVVDGTAWNDTYDMAWEPVFCPNSKHVAAKVQKNGQYQIVLNGKPYQTSYQSAWDPIFSPDGEKIMIRGIENGSGGEKYYRHIVPVAEF